jgi:antitoxin (DNA-binding transcriptional repressor) of toxin-antitoxin stability system
MRMISVSQARASLPQILDQVAAGEEVTITRHGRAVAVVLRPDVVRVRRAEPALREAERLADLLRAAGQSPIPVRQGMTAARADELLRDVRTGRDTR